MGFESDGIRWQWSDVSTTPCSNWSTTTTAGDPVEIKAPDWKKKLEDIVIHTPCILEPLTEPEIKTYGWICPVCGRGNAPWSSSCPCVAPEMKVTC